MIEKKFQALEEYAKQLQNDIESETPPENSVKPSENKENNFFSEQQLEDVFKITSSFSVKGALSESQNEITYDFDESFDLKQELSDYENDKYKIAFSCWFLVETINQITGAQWELIQARMNGVQ